MVKGCTAAPAVPPETLGSRSGSVVTGRDRGATHNCVRVREGLAGCLIAHQRGPGTVRANQGYQAHCVSSDTLVRLASGLDARCVKKQCGVSEDA